MANQCCARRKTWFDRWRGNVFNETPPPQRASCAANASVAHRSKCGHRWAGMGLGGVKDSTTPDGSKQTLQIAISCNQLRHTQIAVMHKLVSLQ
jgi:hypothetical protein